jgi:hypothetical protein
MPKHDGAKKELVQRVKRAVKKSRRKLGAEKFEKELTRTITFLEDLQTKVAQLVTAKAAAAKNAVKAPKTAAVATKKATGKKTTGKKPTGKKPASRKKTPQKPAAAQKGKASGQSSKKK